MCRCVLDRHAGCGIGVMSFSHSYPNPALESCLPPLLWLAVSGSGGRLMATLMTPLPALRSLVESSAAGAFVFPNDILQVHWRCEDSGSISNPLAWYHAGVDPLVSTPMLGEPSCQVRSSLTRTGKHRIPVLVLDGPSRAAVSISI